MKKNIAIYLSLGLQEGCPSYRRSLRFFKESIQHFSKHEFLTVFALLEPDLGDKNQYGSMLIRIYRAVLRRFSPQGK
jgi:hypothetical protein